MGGSAQNTLKTRVGLPGRRYCTVLAFGTYWESRMTVADSRIVASNLYMAVKQGGNISVLSVLIRRIDPCMDILALADLMR